MGVWIETRVGTSMDLELEVTPCVGVWIETGNTMSRRIADRLSHPAWVCGLKLTYSFGLNFDWLSHPAWVCGLKRKLVQRFALLQKVTPCVGVWIETTRYHGISKKMMSHPAWVCGLKPLSDRGITGRRSHTLRGCVD